MYERLGTPQGLPYPFLEFFTAKGEPLTTLDFLPAMRTLLDNMQGLAATCHAASLSTEVAQQEVSQGLFILKEYLEAAVAFFARWAGDVHPGPTVREGT